MLLQVMADDAPAPDRVNKLKFSKTLSEETLRLEPLGDEVLSTHSFRYTHILCYNLIKLSVSHFFFPWKNGEGMRLCDMCVYVLISTQHFLRILFFQNNFLLSVS